MIVEVLPTKLLALATETVLGVDKIGLLVNPDNLPRAASAKVLPPAFTEKIFLSLPRYHRHISRRASLSEQPKTV